MLRGVGLGRLCLDQSDTDKSRVDSTRGNEIQVQVLDMPSSSHDKKQQWLYASTHSAMLTNIWKKLISITTIWHDLCLSQTSDFALRLLIEYPLNESMNDRLFEVSSICITTTCNTAAHKHSSIIVFSADISGLHLLFLQMTTSMNPLWKCDQHSKPGHSIPHHYRYFLEHRGCFSPVCG